MVDKLGSRADVGGQLVVDACATEHRTEHGMHVDVGNPTFREPHATNLPEVNRKSAAISVWSGHFFSF